MRETKLRIPDELHRDITKIAAEKGTSLNQTMEQALKFYRDFSYMENKATIINEEIIRLIQANNALLLQQINHKTNKLLSELAIQSAMQNMVLADELEVTGIRASDYRKKAVEFLQTNNRCLRLDELTD